MTGMVVIGGVVGGADVVVRVTLALLVVLIVERESLVVEGVKVELLA